MKILIAECTQEISSFNPLPSTFEDFAIDRGEALLGRRGFNDHIGGALSVFDTRSGVEIVPTISARAPSAGILSAAGWERLADEVLGAILPHAGSIDAFYFSLHGAMGAEGEPDPEGYLLTRVREAFGDIPIVISLDLHGILTDRMIRQVDGLAIYQTYPHVDFADTGRRAAELLLAMHDRRLRPTIARVIDARAGARRRVHHQDRLLWRRDRARASCSSATARALAAGVMIGNPFTDVPELCTQAIVVAEDDGAFASRGRDGLASRMFWPGATACRQADLARKGHGAGQGMAGPVLFTDAADATSSGASGDSNR